MSDDLYDKLTYLLLLKYGRLSDEEILDRMIIAYLLAKNSKFGLSNVEIMQLASAEFENVAVLSFGGREYYIKQELLNINKNIEKLLLTMLN